MTGVSLARWGRFRADAEGIYAGNIQVLEGVRLLRPIWLLTAVCAPGIGAAAITLAFARMSTIPVLCLAISIPAFAWGLRYARRRPVAYVESIAYIVYCDVAITAGVCVVTQTGIAFLKLVWLVAANTYSFAFHGRVAMAAQAAVTALATALTVGGAVIRGDSSVPALITTVATVVLVNAVAAWAIYAGMSLFAEDAKDKDYLARHDELTGLLNRRGLQQACQDWVGGNADTHVVVAVIDLNGFKSINDNHGHHAGDEVLRQTALKLQALAGPDTWLVRLGGDEFGVVSVVGSSIALDCQRTIEKALGAGGVTVDASVGVASEAFSRFDGAEPVPLMTIVADLLVKADSAMYAVKRSGRSPAAGLIERRLQENPCGSLIDLG
ncbi:GGDEF domain-containing protein [Mycobacteroides chelonae]|jgi:diguanylate cyclase (GGDEF)-like protein|uniref:GGDEF domain-containing protein n=1 Tax=Mycobacteroides chelonae TaxID=1774 RepID=UPI000991BEFB|nr:GGDEF domain-containing protein [Mycobacteroides chelonae]